MLCEFGHFLGLWKADGSVWLLYVCVYIYIFFGGGGFQSGRSGLTKAVKGTDLFRMAT
jgi:hypothetical protein